MKANELALLLHLLGTNFFVYGTYDNWEAVYVHDPAHKHKNNTWVYWQSNAPTRRKFIVGYTKVF